MGFVIVVDDIKDEVTVMLNGRIVTEFVVENIKEGLEAQREGSGADYLEPYAERMIYDESIIKGITENMRRKNEETRLSKLSKLTNEDDKHANASPEILMIGDPIKDAEKHANTENTNAEPDILKLGDPMNDAEKHIDADTSILKFEDPIKDAENTNAEPGIRTFRDPMKDAVISVMWQGYYNTTVADLKAQYDIAKLVWESTNRDFLMWDSRLKALKTGHLSITNIVALGLGSHHWVNTQCCGAAPQQRFMGKGTAVQLVLLMHIRKVLAEEGELLPCVIQDIAYSNLDKKFLRSLNFTVVDDPDAFALIDANSLVFHIGTFARVAWWICDGIWPAVMINESFWGSPAGDLDIFGTHEPPYLEPGLRQMFKSYDVDQEFSEQTFHPAGITNIHLRKYNAAENSQESAGEEKLATQCPSL